MRSARLPGVAGAVLALAALVVSGCRGEVPRFTTWASRGERPARAAAVPVESVPPDGAAPWAGTVSHHLLADALIDRWFAELAHRRSVEVFYILSPSHWGLSAERYSLTDGSWRVPGGEVQSDRGKVAALARALGVPLEPAVFEAEHGISTLIPYIARYFPRATVVAVACRGEPPVDEPMARALSAALAPAFDADGRKKNFLLVSTDFAHHGTEAGTELKDSRTRKFFDSPSRDTWIFAGCDNRPGIYVIAHLMRAETRDSVLFHTDSWRLSGQDPTDITSYFFSYFWDSP